MKRNTKRGLKINAITANIWLDVLILCLFGVIMIYSASALKCLQSKDCNYDSFFLSRKQITFMILGFITMFLLEYMNLKKLIGYRSKLIYFLGIGTIFLLLIPGFGVTSKGAMRWLDLKVISLQPAEIVKISTIIMLAYMMARYEKQKDNAIFTFYLWLIGGIPAFLLLTITNDLSSGLVVLGITFAITFVCCDTIKMHITALIIGIGFVAGYVMHIVQNMPTPEEINNIPFRVARIAAWINPEKYADSKGYQTLQSLYAIGSGGFWGKGLGESTQKISAIPEAQNDMIFSITCEELGWFGGILLIFLILFLIFELTRVAVKANSLFEAVLVMGVVAHLGWQTIINVSVNVNAFPNTGLALPFISYGGTSLVCLMAEIGMCLSVHRTYEDSVSKKEKSQTALSDRKNSKDGGRKIEKRQNKFY